MKRDPRFQNLGDIPQAYRPETIEDAYGVDAAGGGYSNAAVLDTQRRIQAHREQQARDCAQPGPARNVAVRGRFAQSAFIADEASAQILNANPRRLYFLIQNLGPNDVYINFGNKAQRNNVKIVVNGNYEPFVAPLDSVSVICDPGNTATVTVIEGVEVGAGGF